MCGGISQERSVEVEAEEWLFKKDLQLRRLKDEEWRLEEAEVAGEGVA